MTFWPALAASTVARFIGSREFRWPKSYWRVDRSDFSHFSTALKKLARDKMACALGLVDFFGLVVHLMAFESIYNFIIRIFDFMTLFSILRVLYHSARWTFLRAGLGLLVAARAAAQNIALGEHDPFFSSKIAFWRVSGVHLSHLCHVLYKMARYFHSCLLYTSPSPRDQRGSRMPSSA